MRFSVTVNHVKGKHHFTADALSRAPVGSSTEKDEHFVEEVESFAAQKVVKTSRNYTAPVTDTRGPNHR